MVDCGLMQNLLETNKENLFKEDLLAAAGPLVEQYVGQELKAAYDSWTYRKLYYWARERTGSSAEIDYLVEANKQAVPVEVKSGSNGHLKSLRLFVDEFKPPLAVKISEANLSFKNKLLSLPLYAVSQLDRMIREYLVRL